ncbi:MAG: ABC-type transporter, permease subunit [Frankiales bacterium]|jgi:putative spermidine/putrescine transport system permease protein|nr:ABC-type transporter, permease subunit [Frankiales bacterium]
MAAVTRPAARRATVAVRWMVLGLAGVFFVLPLYAMLDFSTKGVGGARDLSAWRAIPQDEELRGAIVTSMELAGLTAVLMLVLLVPTLTWVRLRLPRVQRLVEFLCLLPLIIPAIVLVVGIAPLYSWVTYVFGDTPLTLTFVYVVLVLPYAYRALDAGLAGMDLKTLSEAARSLGASWTTVMLRVVLPNLRGAVLSAALLSVALVLGEFTLASLLNFQTLQVAITLTGKRNAALAIAVSLAALVFAFVLLVVLTRLVGRRRDGAETLAPAAPTAVAA